MTHLAKLFLAGVILCLSALSLSAQPKTLQNMGDISMKSIEALRQKGVGPKVIGGTEARSDDWPASFYSSAEGGRCTATLIGPRVLILAAHCVGNGEQAAIEFRGKPFSGICTHSDKYKEGQGDASADYALCSMPEGIAGIQFETVSLDPSRIKKGNRLLLTGYGCTSPPAPGSTQPSGGNDGKYRTASAAIVAVPGESQNEPNTIITRDQYAICPGDSGGGAYIVLTPKRRLIVSVNSRVIYQTRESYLSSLSSDEGRAFLNKWLSNNSGAAICGINLRDQTCK
jgi:hypothetical protein